MSSGKTHSTAALVTLLPIAGFSIYLASQGFVEPAIGLTVGGVCGWLVTPDADVDGITHEEVRWFKINPLLGHVWHLFWWPYGKMFKHRGSSHIIFWGTLTRILYIVATVTLGQLLWVLCLEPNFIGADLFFVHLYNSFPYFCRATYLAWSVQDAIHVIFDICSTWLKRRRLLWYAHV